MTAYATHPQVDPHAPRNDRALRRERAYRDAVRHSRRVRFLKRAIPAVAMLSLAGMIFFAFFNPFREKAAHITLESVGVTGSKIVMDAPKLQGFKKDSRPYEMKAESAAQQIKTPHIIELTKLDGHVAMGTDGSATLSAPAGVFDSKKETISLQDDVRVTTNTGYDIRLKSADVEFKTGHVVSNQAVEVTMKSGTISADALEVIDNGKQIVFTGRVRTVLIGEGPDSPEPQSSGGKP
ncbi:MAG: LPS export ABC transporter periplasmic protein LptC [Beijerinckiaceae bacterium]